MGRALRAEQFRADEVGIVHAMQRCVRRAFLAGKDPLTGKSFEFRREWIRRRLELLSAVFGLDVLTYAIMSNHLHVVLRTRPDVVKTWSDEEVATRWLKLFPGKRLEEHLGDPTQWDIQRVCGDAKRLKEIRRRLSDVSWFMKALAEPIARLANKQDGCTGRFWEGRFRAQKIVDEAGLLACAMYVDLNPIRSAMAVSPEQSLYTSAYDRILGLKGKQIVSAAMEEAPKKMLQEALERTVQKAQQENDADKAQRAREKLTQMHQQRLIGERKARRIARDQWLCPLELNELKQLGAQASPTGVRASDKGFLGMSLGDYLKLLDWTGRQGKQDKPGRIPSGLAPILERIGIEGKMWCDLVWNFKRYFGRSRALGRPEKLQQEAEKSKHRWIHGQRKAAECFA
jgi:hypothetical protein